MTRAHRQPQPLSRETQTDRDDRPFILAYDDTCAPKQYFDFFRIPRIRVHVVPTQDGSSAAKHVLDRLLAVDHDADDELWLVLDTDHCIHGEHLAGFTQTLAEAPRQGVRVTLSRPSLELWLLLTISRRSRSEVWRARLDESATGGEIPQTNATRVHQIWRSIVTAAPQQQLPVELRSLLVGLPAPCRLTGRGESM
jgi:hypothetical protein